ncbi:uncharacterized protein LOC119836047 [Zerene cesonia]|uniref:uncharacterized protein LOC119836047 n=1 Tax=Zerene cesonia TaxID=33412 RepID=UPI0018E570AC|nr:uncharacterized protein LOC119836047 [Zerene cesonia]
MARSRSIKLVTALILLALQTTTAAKTNARPVYEVINEQARMDDIRLSSGPSNLPYGNPLAGNSAHNARLHASNQQAMFNAERIRQHKAQLQRLTQGPPIIDSYMKAYHESQESHQLALEQQQAIIRDDVTTQPSIPRKQIRVRVPQNSKPRTPQSTRDIPARNVQRTQIPKTNQRQEFKSRTANVEAMEKLIRANSVKERNRNHRSYDSVEYQQYLESKQPQTNVPNTAFEEGVTIKPNGNIGLAQEQKQAASILQPNVLYNGKYIPKNVQNYHAAKEINTLELLLKKNPKEQLSEFKTLVDSDRSFESDENSHAPLDLYYYLKDPSQTPSNNYDQIYTEQPHTYSSDYLNDYTPITEEIDDIENPTPYKSTYVTPQLSTEAPRIESSTLHTNYYKVEVASQTVSTDYKPSKINEELIFNGDPSYEKTHYGYQPEDPEHDINESSKFKGVQHLAEDGTGVSAYGDENLHYAANYEFGYRVRDSDSGNFYGQYEAKKGESTKGHYHVLLPDGRMQQVVYSAGPSGYHADISYDHLKNE